MIIKEFRIVMNMTLDEYSIGNRYCMAKYDKMETGGGEGVEILTYERFTAEEGVQPPTPLLGGTLTEGRYEHKLFHLKSKVPWYIRKMAPDGLLELHTETWDAYPYYKTIFSSSDHEQSVFQQSLESFHVLNNGHQENIFNLSELELAQREVIYLDIVNEEIQPRDYNPEEDPKLFKSVKTGRGPLTADWQKEATPIMCIYKLMRCQINWLPIVSTFVEKFLMKTQRRLALNYHRRIHCWMDEWHGLSEQELKTIEDQLKQETNELHDQGEVRGTIGDDEDNDN